jgi:hypothetical protein
VPPRGQAFGTADARPIAWRVPAGWRTETIAFPLGFAPTVAHEGFEELRFPPGMFTAGAPDYWSYVFVWRLDDAARLDASQLADELTRYFRGLITAVDADKHQVKEPERVVATARVDGDRFAIAADIFDAFGDGRAVELQGWAQRHDCGSGVLWTFVLAPAATSIRAELDELAGAARASYCK